MARKYKIKRRKKNPFSRFVPESLQAFIARRLIDGTGLAMTASGAFVLAAIISYNAADPSLNTAAMSGRASNWLGTPGAALADLLLQTLGLGSAVFGLGIAVWGYSIFRRRPLGSLWRRFAALVAGALLASVAFARIPAGAWLAHAYLGGSGGTLMLNMISSRLQDLALPGAHLSISAIAGAAALACVLYAMAIRKEEWRRFYAFVKIMSVRIWFFVSDLAVGFAQWVSHYGNPEFRPDAVRRKREKTRKLPDISSLPDALPEQGPDAYGAQESCQGGAPVNSGPDAGGMAIKVVTPAPAAASSGHNQARFHLEDGVEWELPGLDLLQDDVQEEQSEQLDENALRMNAELLQNVLSDFKVKGDIVSIHPGPVVTLYELEPAPGTKTSRVIGLCDDIARSMAAVSVRAAVVPGRNVIGIELPNARRQIVYLRDLLATREYEKTQAKLPVILGKDIGGKPIIADLTRMPHLLVAGTTGSGKSVGVNTMILSLLYRLPPEKCRFIMIDPKMLELSVYDDIPHLLSPVVTEPGRAIVALKWVVQEMEERYRAMSKLGVRNIDGYNARLAEARKKGEVMMRKVQTGFDPETGKPVYEEQPLDLTELPYIVVVVDEFADLMLVAGKEVENAIQRLAQMARAAGIHLIMATQRPSVDVITGVIKANFPTRISFAVTSKIDSRTILGDGGAEQLLGMGDMLYMSAGGRIKRVHGPFSSDEDVENVVNFLRAQAAPSYLEDITESGGDFAGEGGLAGLYGDFGGEQQSEIDDLYDQAVAVVARERKASTSFIQRHLQIGYNRAARIVEEMEKQGVIGPANHVGKREILVQDHSES